MSIKYNSEGKIINYHRGAQSCSFNLMNRILYESQAARMRAFEDLIIELSGYTDSHGLKIVMPQLNELVNIYDQAEFLQGK